MDSLLLINGTRVNKSEGERIRGVYRDLVNFYRSIDFKLVFNVKRKFLIFLLKKIKLKSEKNALKVRNKATVDCRVKN